MNAQKLSNGTIAIGNGAPRKDAIQVIEDLKVGEFYKLVKCTIQWSSRINDKRDIMFAPAPDGSKLKKEFDSMYNRREAYNEKIQQLFQHECLVDERKESTSNNSTNNVDGFNKKEVVKYESDVVGTSRIVYIRNRQSITIRKRTHASDKYNKSNSVCISNEMRDEFFKDIRGKSKKYAHSEIKQSNNEELFNKWMNRIKEIFESGLKYHSNNASTLVDDCKQVDANSMEIVNSENYTTKCN